MLKYLSVSQVVEIHRDIMKNFGGAHGVRSTGLLESAVFRMRASFGGVDLYKNIFEQAAALFESLCRNHPFLDGNKRTAFVAAVTFLEINRYRTEFDLNKTEEFVLSVAMGKQKFKSIAAFFKKHAKKTKS